MGRSTSTTCSTEHCEYVRVGELRKKIPWAGILDTKVFQRLLILWEETKRRRIIELRKLPANRRRYSNIRHSVDQRMWARQSLSANTAERVGLQPNVRSRCHRDVEDLLYESLRLETAHKQPNRNGGFCPLRQRYCLSLIQTPLLWQVVPVSQGHSHNHF